MKALFRQAGGVKRFHTVPTIGTQTVAEHSFNVCMILVDLCGNKTSTELLKAALFHDLPEVETGDIPATAKWSHPMLKSELDTVEDRFVHKHCLQTTLDISEQLALKHADMIELVQYCLDQLRMGNKNMLPIAQRGIAYLKHLPEFSEYGNNVIKSLEHCVRDYE